MAEIATTSSASGVNPLLVACDALDENVQPVVKLVGSKTFKVLDGDCGMIADALRRNTACRALHLDLNDISDDGIAAIARALTNPLRSMEAEGGNKSSPPPPPVDVSSSGGVCAVLPASCVLEVLRLSGNRITDRGARVLIDNLPPTLHTLDLSCNHLTNATVAYLFQYMARAAESVSRGEATVQCTLTHVELRDNPGIDDDCWHETLAPFLQHPVHAAHLQSLFISGNPFTNGIVGPVAAIISANRSLRALGIGNSAITNYQPIVDAVVQDNAVLYTLPLSYLTSAGSLVRYRHDQLENKLKENRRQFVWDFKVSQAAAAMGAAGRDPSPGAWRPTPAGIASAAWHGVGGSSLATAGGADEFATRSFQSSQAPVFPTSGYMAPVASLASAKQWASPATSEVALQAAFQQELQHLRADHDAEVAELRSQIDALRHQAADAV